MPINVPHNLPAKDILEQENIFVMDESRATSQDIRPLNILILNIMPNKECTETQLLRLLGNTPLQVNITFLRPETHESKTTSKNHLDMFYTTFQQVEARKFDGMIITGAPIEHLSFEDVSYWNEIAMIMEWTKTNVTSTLHICWGAQAGLYHHFGIMKYPLSKKCSGIFQHCNVVSNIKLLKGFDDIYNLPHSRYTEVRAEDIVKVPLLKILAISDVAGVCLVATEDGKQIFLTGHPEYENTTLRDEYERDIKKGISVEIPKNYFPDDDPSKEPPYTWRSHANLLFSNWLNYYVYQETPYIWD